MLRIETGHTATGQQIIRPVGELDTFSVSVFRQALADAAPAGRTIIDLSGIPFMDSAGIGALVDGIRRTRELGGDIAVACSRPALLRLLRTTGLDRIVTTTATVSQAAAALRPVRPRRQSPPIALDRVDDDPTA